MQRILTVEERLYWQRLAEQQQIEQLARQALRQSRKK